VGHLDGRRQPDEHDRERDPDDAVGQHDCAVGVELGQPAVAQQLHRHARRQCSDRRHDRADEVVPGEDARPPPVGHEPGQRGLLDGQERPDLLAARAGTPIIAAMRRSGVGNETTAAPPGGPPGDEDLPPAGRRRGSSARARSGVPISAGEEEADLRGSSPSRSRYTTSTTASPP
jgi:hypothetical protein